MIPRTLAGSRSFVVFVYMTISMDGAAHLRTLIPADAIDRRVRELGASIASDYGESGRVPHLVCVLKGAVVFLADLVRAIDVDVTVDFVQLSSYGESTTSSGMVRLTKNVDSDLEGRDVVVVEDIVDTGLTLRFLVDDFRERGARSIRVVALLDKRSRRRVDVPIDYVGFSIDDVFVVGYGLDLDDHFRALPYVAAVDDSYFEP